jgi:uncharacterized damage-inducible protein DinB
LVNLASIRTLLGYNDWADSRLLEASGPLSDEQLDRGFDMGPGSLRRTLIHIWAGESVWLARWMGKAETRWPDEAERLPLAEIQRRFGATWVERARFLATLADADLAREQVYRDSKGSLFRAKLGNMLIQGVTHSLHHRAQAVNMLRHVGAGLVELDYMMWERRPA